MEVRGAYYNTKALFRELEALLRKLPDPSEPCPLPAERRRVGTARQLNAEQTQQLIEAYRAGATVYELGDRFGINRKTVGKILTRNGVRTKHPGLTPDQVDEAVRLYTDGASLAGIGEHLDVTARTVQLRLRERGLKLRGGHWRGIASQDTRQA
ncbi:MAG: hypothetical protein WKF73_18135 [Nocardioidaceae bacterium]